MVVMLLIRGIGSKTLGNANDKLDKLQVFTFPFISNYIELNFEYENLTLLFNTN